MKNVQVPLPAANSHHVCVWITQRSCHVSHFPFDHDRLLLSRASSSTNRPRQHSGLGSTTLHRCMLLSLMPGVFRFLSLLTNPLTTCQMYLATCTPDATSAGSLHAPSLPCGCTLFAQHFIVHVYTAMCDRLGWPQTCVPYLCVSALPSLFYLPQTFVDAGVDN